jgi:LysM repeat protein
MARALTNLPASLRHSRQRSYFATYRVRRGDALSVIARRYGTSTAAIMRANNLRSASFIRAGQLLRIPTGSRAAAAPPRYHRVQPGETLWEIARRYGTSVSTLMSDNNIGSANRLQVGQRLQIQSGSRTRVVDYRVRLGDTLSGIAQRYGTSVAQIKRDNNLRDADLVRLGQKLRIQADADDAQALAATRHRVRPGQTLEGIARQYGLSTRSLVRHNKISDPNQIRSGQWLSIPSR